MKRFEDLGINPAFINSLYEQGFDAPTEVQARAIPIINSGKDLVALSQTGTGKTLAFILPILNKITPEHIVQALILCPTRELAEQILLEFKKIIGRTSGLRAVAVFGGADMH